MNFNYTVEEVKILKNFSTISSSMVIGNKEFSIVNAPKSSLIGVYPLEKEYQYDSFGIFDLNEFLNLINQFKNYSLDLKERSISIIDQDTGNLIDYNLTPIEMIKTAPIDKLKVNFDNIKKHVEFKFSEENLNTLKKIIAVLKPERLFFQSENGYIKITAADKVLESSTNPLIIKIREEDISFNELEDTTLYFTMDEMKLLDGEYQVSMSKNGISLWKNKIYKVDYFIGVFKEE